MEIPQAIQEKLKCSECDELLSCGPVYLIHQTGGTICGRCSPQPEDTDSDTETTEEPGKTRNGPYEATASLLAFPCAFASKGCLKKLPFTVGTQSHEATCEFRPVVCPIAPQNSCTWIDSLGKLKEHFDEEHPANVLYNPCSPPRPDLTQSNLQTYLIPAFNFLFLLQIQVCIISGKLFHSVRMFGNSNIVEKFSFNLEIEGNDMKIIKEGRVLQAGIPVVQEETEVCTIIEKLLGIFDGKYNECKFTIMICYCIDDDSADIIRNDSNLECVQREEFLKKCKFNYKGCLFADENKEKCEKHEIYFCEYQKECCISSCKISLDSSSFDHLSESICSQYTYKSYINSAFRITFNNENYFILFPNSNIGNILCQCNAKKNNLKLWLYTSLPWYELKKYECSIKLMSVGRSVYKPLVPLLSFETRYDWYSSVINLENSHLTEIETAGLDIKIKIEKKSVY